MIEFLHGIIKPAATAVARRAIRRPGSRVNPLLHILMSAVAPAATRQQPLPWQRRRDAKERGA